MLHPCQTAELMRLMLPACKGALSFQQGLQYMMAWFSLVSPVLALSLQMPAGQLGLLSKRRCRGLGLAQVSVA